ncbi:MAG: hypothetical protein M1284_01380 [Candidatus Parvarchaeota archaeon]|jgi:hypothetical protein|nr:hypothetical protein [Candidatus Parvarchaeota archaeon]MCL5420386.1 hypothetical protein [Candidatus Parvarchaeota archaeon]
MEESNKHITWQGENCLLCKYFVPNDVINADLLERGKCAHPSLVRFNLVVSGRDWCNLFSKMSDQRRDKLLEEAFKRDDEQLKRLTEESKKPGNFDQ